MATKTSTSVSTHISQNGDNFVVKETTTKTTTSPGKDPVVETTETVTEYKGEENLPENIRKQLKNKKVEGKINMNATRGKFAEDVLREVNNCRKLHGVEPLKLSSNLLEYCEKRAKKMAEIDDMNDNTEDNFGTSITCMSSNDPEFYIKPDVIVNRWYSGSHGYDYSKEPDELNAGHFTQMIWKNSKQFGVAAAKSKTNQIYIVACFNPRGNYINQFLENVCRPVKKDKSIFGNSTKSLIISFFDKKKSEEQKSSKSEDISDFNKEGLDCHNKYRKRHGVPPLKYSKELAAYAQEWANELARCEKLEHRSEGKYGENLYYEYNSNPNVSTKASDACDSWYSEISDYVFGREPLSTSSGHFTQMVWKYTEEVGMGIAKSRNGKQYIVANYNPPGNYFGRYKINVPEPLY